MTTVSVIIPTLNNARTIESCLSSLEHQSMPPDEIIVVDCGSCDETPDIAARHATVLSSPIANRCYQNNMGARAATSSTLLFLDADMTLSPEVLAEGLRIMNEHESNVALSVREISYGGNFWARVRCFERGFYSGVWWIEAARWFPRSAFEAASGFDTRMMGTEDWDLDERLRELVEVVGVASPIYHDEGTPTLRHIAARKAHYAGTFSTFSIRHPERARMAMSVRRRAALFLRQPRHLLAHPILTAGIVVIGLTEIASTRGWLHTNDPWPQETPLEKEPEDD